MLPGVCKNCMYSPQRSESAWMLPTLGGLVHECSLGVNTVKKGWIVRGKVVFSSRWVNIYPPNCKFAPWIKWPMLEILLEFLNTQTIITLVPLNRIQPSSESNQISGDLPSPTTVINHRYRYNTPSINQIYLFQSIYLKKTQNHESKWIWIQLHFRFRSGYQF